jgi:homoserine kinase type II
MAVYTEVTDEDLRTAIASYGLGELLSYKGIAEGVENTNYVVHTTEGTFILTLYEKRVARADLPFFLGLMEHLAARGVACPVPVRNLKGENLTELAGRAAAIITFLEGVWTRRPTVEHCGAVGRALAGFHLAGRDYPLKRRNALGLDGWRALFSRIEDRVDTITPGLSREIAAELDQLAQVWPQDLETGVVHADLFPDNVFFLGKRLSGLIDFYFACNDAFAYDIAICINAWCFEPDFTFNLAKSKALLDGYNDVRKLSEVEREALPTLARGAALRFLLTRSHDWFHASKDALVHPHDPIDYVHRLNFHRGVRTPTEYGL